MRIKCLLYLFTGLAITFAISSCRQKQQGISTKAAAENKISVNDSVVLPLTVIVTDDAIEGRKRDVAGYPKTIVVEGFDTIATPIGMYAAAQGLWLAPRGYTGSAAAGADGSVAVSLFPPDGNEAKPPFVRYQRIPACVGCMMNAAAPYFENARADLLANYDSTMLEMITIPDKLIVQKRSGKLVTYTYMKGNSLQITGVAYYSSPTDSERGGFMQAEFALGANNKALTDLLVNRYISMWGLK